MSVVFSSAPRIACVDLTFNWPPVGGCWIDTYHVLQGLQERGAHVSLFVPEFQEYYPRGDIREDLPFPSIRIPFNRYTYNFSQVMKRFRHRVNAFKPDLIFVTDGYFMKNHILTALSPERCLLRFYAYELLCVNLHYYRYHENRICDQGFFTNPRECHRCWFHRMPAAGRGLQILLGMREQHPKLHFSQEYLTSLAFTETYRQRLLNNFRQLNGAIVYNDFMRSQLLPYVDDIHIIPSGVDPNRFTSSDHIRDSETPVKIFLPGRANDPLKGLPVLIEACDRLIEEGLSFEVHYTAAMDCPTRRVWLKNRGWVNQEELPRFYQEMDIVTVPSTWIEPFGITALEAMACGLPVVASRIGGLAETVVHGETGLHFQPGDPEHLADALRTLIMDTQLRQTYGQAGRERIMLKYDWGRILDNTYIPLVEESLRKLHTSRLFNLYQK